MRYRIRGAAGADESFLVDMLYEALFVPPGEEPYPRSIIDRLDLARHVRGFGEHSGGVGVVTEYERGPIGAAWVRQMSRDDPGYGFVDDSTPGLSVVMVNAYRRRGVGTALLTGLLERVEGFSLAVDERNPARPAL